MSRTTSILMGVRSMMKLYESMLKEVCEEYQLAQIEVTIISFLYNNPGKDTAADIVELRGLSKGAVSKAVECLIQKTLLERVPDLEDRRKIHLKIMPEAGPVTESINEVKEEFVGTILEGFTKEELEMQSQFLDRLFENTKRAIEM